MSSRKTIAGTCSAPIFSWLPSTTVKSVAESSSPRASGTDLHTGKPVGGGKTINVTARETSDLPPLFVRGGALIPMLSRPVNRTDQIKGAALEVRLYGRENATCEVYEDEWVYPTTLEGGLQHPAICGRKTTTRRVHALRNVSETRKFTSVWRGCPETDDSNSLSIAYARIRIGTRAERRGSRCTPWGRLANTNRPCRPLRRVASRWRNVRRGRDC